MSRVPTNRVPPGESVIDRAPGTPAAYTSIRNPGGSLIFSNGSSAPRPRAATSRTTKTRADPRLALRHNPGWIRVRAPPLPLFPTSPPGGWRVAMSSRKLPKTTQKTIVRTPVDQELSLPVTDHANDNVVMGKKSFRRLARDAFLKALAAGLAPVRKGADRALGIPGSADDRPQGHHGAGSFPPPARKDHPAGISPERLFHGGPP